MNAGSVMGFLRLARHSRYAIGKIRAVVDAHSKALENLRTEGGDERYANAEGSWTFRVGGGGGAGGGKWSGIVWYLGELKWDFSRTDADPAGEPLDGGVAVGGIYLKIRMSTGSTEWSDTCAYETDEYNYYPVGERVGSGDQAVYVLSTNRTCGDIRIEMAPYYAPAEEE